MKNINEMDYSEFSLWADENYDKVTTILEYDDFCVYLVDDKYYFYECDIEGDASDFYEVEIIAKLLYDINNYLLPGQDKNLIGLFDCDCCGECIANEQLEYLWFKRIKSEI